MADEHEAVLERLETAKDDPGTVPADRLVEHLDADRGEVRTAALGALYALAREDPDRVAAVADAVVDRLDDPHLVASSTAALTLAALARERPDAVRPAIPALIADLDHETPLVRFRAAGALGPLADPYPGDFVEHADALVDVLVDGPTVDAPANRLRDAETADEFASRKSVLEARADELERDRTRSEAVRETVAHALVEVASEDPDAIADRLPDLEPVLAGAAPPVRGATVAIAGRIAEADPGAVEPVRDALLDRLEDDEATVRARAIRALGFAEATAAVEPLREVAESDPDPEVADLAAETASWLADRA